MVNITAAREALLRESLLAAVEAKEPSVGLMPSETGTICQQRHLSYPEYALV